MDPMFLFVLFAVLLVQPLILIAQSSRPSSHITIRGSVFCDVCHDNTFSRHSYFLPGVNVHIGCKFKANFPGTTEQITFSVNRTTNRYGVYKLNIPYLDGVDCMEDPGIQSFCEARLIGNSSSACKSPGVRSTTNEITVKSKQSNLCIYSMSALSYRPLKKNVALCGNKNMRLPYSLNSSKFFLPNFPPYGMPWPPLPPFPSFPFPPLPPLPSLPPLPPLPSLPPFGSFPFPPVQFPGPPSPSSAIPTLPPFIPRPSLVSPPPPPTFNLGDPSTWIPNYPLVSPPHPPGFNLGDPRAWIPYYPPSPPAIPQQYP